MTPSHFWHWYSWLLLALGMAAEGSILWLSIKTGFFKRLLMLTILAAFCVLTDAVGAVLSFFANVDAVGTGGMYFSKTEWVFYWYVNVIAGFLVLVLAIQIITEVLKLRYLVTLWSVVLVFVFMWAADKLLPTSNTGRMLMALTIADVLCAVGLLVIGLVPSTQWPKGFPWIVAGIVASVGLGALCSVLSVLLHTLVGVFTIGAPVASLIGSCLYIAGMVTFQRSKTLETQTT